MAGRMRFMAVVTLLALAVAACQSPQESQSSAAHGSPGASAGGVSSGTVTALTSSFGNERFDYSFAVGAVADYPFLLHCLLIETDVIDGQRQLTPGVATEWAVSDDGLTWVFQIRDGVKFHDGSEVTAEDVAWTLQHSIGPEALDWATGPAQSLAEVVASVEQTGANEVTVTTTEPIVDLPTTLSDAGGAWFGIMPKRDTLRNEQEETDYDAHPIGCGPFKFVSHTAGSEMVFERFEDYYYTPANGFREDRRPKFARMDLKLVPEEATRVAALEAGEADIALVNFGAQDALKERGGRIVFGLEGVAFEVQGFGCWVPTIPCSDKRVRQALAYAINKERIQQLYGPEVMQIKGVYAVSPSTIGYNADLDPYPYDLEKAKQLLADAGYPNGAGFGKLIINTWESPAIPQQPESALLAAEDWRALGLDVEVNVGDESALKEIYKTTDDLYGQYIWKDQQPRFDASVNLRQGYKIKEDKFSRAHSDPELEAYIEERTAIADPEARVAALHEAYLRVKEEAYHIGIGFLNIPWGVGPRIVTWDPYPTSATLSAIHTITLSE